MKQILLVEDDDDIRDVLETILTEEGYGVKSCETAAEASAWVGARECELDLVLLDFMLASGNTSGFLRELRAGRKLGARRLPVLMMSAADPGLRDGADEQVDGFLQKPIVVEEMLSEIERIFAPRPAVSSS